MSYKEEIENERDKIKQVYQEYLDRRCLLNIREERTATLFYEGVEFLVRNGKIIPLDIDCSKDTKEFIVPEWLECFSESRDYINYYLNKVRFGNEKSVYAALSNFERIKFISDDIVLNPFELSCCEKLKYADISVLSRAPAGLFSNCKLLEEVDARKLEVIEKATFQNCINLKKVIISSSLRRVKQKAFSNINENLEIEVIDSLNKELRIRKDNSNIFKEAIERHKEAAR